MVDIKRPVDRRGFGESLKSRNDYIEYVVKTCVKNKLVPLYWDAGYTEKLFDRTTGQPHNAASIAAIMKGLN